MTFLRRKIGCGFVGAWLVGLLYLAVELHNGLLANGDSGSNSNEEPGKPIILNNGQLVGLTSHWNCTMVYW